MDFDNSPRMKSRSQRNRFVLNENAFVGAACFLQNFGSDQLSHAGKASGQHRAQRIFVKVVGKIVVHKLMFKLCRLLAGFGKSAVNHIRRQFFGQLNHFLR